VLIMLLHCERRGLRAWLTWENLLAGGSVLLVLGCYYFSASATEQPKGILLGSELNIRAFVLFTFTAWGVFTGVLWLHRAQLLGVMGVFAFAVFTSMGILSLFYYGGFSDLLVRSSATLMYSVLLLFLYVMQGLWANGRRMAALCLVVILSPGCVSALVNLTTAIVRYDEHVQGQSVIDFGQGWQFLGKESSWYVRYLSAPPEQ